MRDRPRARARIRNIPRSGSSSHSSQHPSPLIAALINTPKHNSCDRQSHLLTPVPTLWHSPPRQPPVPDPTPVSTQSHSSRPSPPYSQPVEPSSTALPSRIHTPTSVHTGAFRPTPAPSGPASPDARRAKEAGHLLLYPVHTSPTFAHRLPLAPLPPSAKPSAHPSATPTVLYPWPM